jgi:Tfp pilus assembly protein PilE
MLKKIIIFVVLLSIGYYVYSSWQTIVLTDKKSIVDSTLRQHIQQSEKVTCQYSGFTIDKNDTKYTLDCENGKREIDIDVRKFL